MRECVLTDEEGKRFSWDNLAGRGEARGRILGAQHVAVFLREKAVAAFQAKNDKEATFLRDLADEILAKVVPDLERRKDKQERDFPVYLGDDGDD